MKLEDVHRVYMLGIGGIGMSGIAQYLRLKGREVSGYDRTATPVTQMLERAGIPVFFEPGPERLSGVDLVIYTPAVSKSHPDFVEAQRLGIPIYKRAEILGMISRSQKTIAIAGTHGKTSTTGLVTHLLRSCGIDCTAFIGGISKNLGTNFVYGNSEWVVVEADEFDRSFLQLNPELAVVTSMDPDHLDIYGTGDEVQNSYRQFMAKVKPGGKLFLNQRISELVGETHAEKITFGVNEGNRRAVGVTPHGIGMTFDYVSDDRSIASLKVNFPGRYNVENAMAAVSITLEAGGKAEDIRKGLEAFTGIQRRFDVQFISDRFAYIDDYAHHPEEIRSLMNAVHDVFPGRPVIAAFQPHLFTRTRDFAEGFAASLSLADKVVLLSIYPAREEPIPGITSSIIFDRITATEKTLTDLKGLIAAVDSMKEKDAVGLTIGAGDIDTKVEEVKNLVASW